MPLVTASGVSRRGKAGCRDADVLQLEVRPHPASRIAPGTPYQLDVFELPPIENGGRFDLSLEDAFTPLASVGPPTAQVESGRWAASAPVLPTDQDVHLDLPLGRVRWVSVPVSYGQELVVTAAADPRPDNVGAGLEMLTVSLSAAWPATRPAWGRTRCPRRPRSRRPALRRARAASCSARRG
ncbi:MAG: hypothetical protein R2731_08145 [Nocardioides sp.]